MLLPNSCQSPSLPDASHNSQGHPDFPGINILGTNMWIDIERVYNMEKINSDDIKTHMQTDKISVDFGFITNAGTAHQADCHQILTSLKI